MNNPDISIVILTMNRPLRCQQTAEQAAIAAQGLKAEILIVNNGNEPAPMPENLQGIPCQTLVMSRNLGAEARNKGWQAAQGSAVLMLDDDAIIQPGLPATLINGLNTNPNIGALFFRVHDGKKQEGCLLPTVFHGCACGFRRNILEQTGGYPKGFVYYGEEYDLTFRMYKIGLPPKLCSHAPAVHHARDPGGRNTARIIRFLIRNNTETWFAHFSFWQALMALSDTLRWYKQVGIKEGAQSGFMQGCSEIPTAMLRGLARRQTMPKDMFDAVTLIGAVAKAVDKIRKTGLTRVAICGVGKFPSFWLKTIRQAGLTPVAFLDHNPAWLNQKINGVSVLVKSDATWPFYDPSCAWLTGTSSDHDNRLWLNELSTKQPSPPIFSALY